MQQPTIHRIKTPTGNVICYEWMKDAPTVVLLTGMGVPAQSWWKAENEPILTEMMAEPFFLAPVLAKHFHVLAYDRAGMGESDKPTQPRTLSELLDELGAVIKELAGEPTILLGHSIGGLIAFEWAQRHQETVRALVLLDSSHPYQVERLNRWRPESECEAYHLMMSEIAKGHDERLDFLRIFSDVSNVSESLGHLPLLIISRGIPATAQDLQISDEPLTPEIAEKLATEWQKMQADLASASRNSTQLVARNSRHYMHFDEPRWTASQVMHFLDSLDS